MSTDRTSLEKGEEVREDTLMTLRKFGISREDLTIAEKAFQAQRLNAEDADMKCRLFLICVDFIQKVTAPL